MNADDLAFLPLHELAPLIARHEVSPVELIDAQLYWEYRALNFGHFFILRYLSLIILSVFQILK